MRLPLNNLKQCSAINTVTDDEQIPASHTLTINVNPTDVVDINVTAYAASAQAENGDVKCWGYGENYSLNNGKVKCWGYDNDYATLGVPEYLDQYIGDGTIKVNGSNVAGEEMGDNLKFLNLFRE